MKKFSNLLIAASLCLISFSFGAYLFDKQSAVTPDDANHAQRLIGTSFTQPKIDSMLYLLDSQLVNYERMRNVPLPNNIPLAYNFNPIPVGFNINHKPSTFQVSNYNKTVLPADTNQIAFYSIGELHQLLITKKITSLQLTKFFLARLHKYGSRLHCVVAFTDSLALVQAKEADRKIAAGHFTGLLQGIPFGVKDMYATKNYATTFGTPPYRNQHLNYDATVVKRLQDAGAVLCVKLSLGELAMDDVWFGGKTRNPWDTSKGSSGSSAGPGAAVSAGLVPFAIGSETWGSIVSPSTVCGVTGLRPTFGRVPRTGAMALSWTMDKVGPLCRNAEDAAIIFHYIEGSDGKDQSVIDAAFNYSPSISLRGMKIGYFEKDFEKDSASHDLDMLAMHQLKNMGAELIPMQLPDLPVNDMSLLLLCEAASAFDELTLTNRDDLMVQQGRDRWPNVFRAAHFIPATEYIRANRLRYELVQQMNDTMKKVDLCIAPALAGDNLLVTNLTGNPAVCIPNGFVNNKTPASIVFIGQLFEEGKILAVAKAYQDATGFQLKHPPFAFSK